MNESPWEDHLLERKTENDLKDLLKTMVAFANSVRPGQVAEILIGELDDGTAQGVTNADNIQKKVRADAHKVYPPMNWEHELYQKGGKTCVRVKVAYSGETPHFGGQAWVRKGSQTIEATTETFQKLIEYRTSKVRRLAEHIGETVTLRQWPHFYGKPLPSTDTPVTLREVDQYCATFELESGKLRSEPLETLTLSRDHKRNCLRIDYKPPVL